MKIKLCDKMIDTTTIKQLHKKTKRLYAGLGKIIRPHYAVEYNDGTYCVITKKEYKMLKKVVNNERKDKK